ncbi:MAG TPA: hypothetical protein VL096_06660 [Pirellulaceae bacterium]|nr:hypothetical protein [Pirellulaceae bacterium]
MKYQELIIALPCHSLEDFPLYHTGEAAEGLLASWTALWHPALIAAAERIVSWCRNDTPPEDLANKLLVVPSVSASDMPTGFAQRAKEQGACVIRKQSVRSEIIKLALAELDGGDAGIPNDLTLDFLALGYCYLQVQLLTRQMRYASNLDEIHFKNVVVDAAQAAVRGDELHARERLQACFNLLAEERDRYYPVEAFLLDLTLVGPTTLGKALRDDLTAEVVIAAPQVVSDEKAETTENSEEAAKIKSHPHVSNLLLSAETLALMAEKEPETLAVLRQAMSDKRAGIIGGHYHEGQTSFVSRLSLRDDFQRGFAKYEELLDARPIIYGRYRFGLSPVLPQLLTKLGFVGALHLPFEDGKTPEGTQLKVRWEGADGSAIDAIARPPLDATKAETFLGLAVKMGESMDRDHVATVCLAHWPGQASVWYEDLRRIAQYCPALGKFISIDEYFSTTDTPTQLDRYTLDQYRSPYFKQQVIRRVSDPLSRVVRYWQRRAALNQLQALTMLSSLVSGDLQTMTTSYADRIDAGLEEAESAELDNELKAALHAANERFAGLVPTVKGSSQKGYLVSNPSSYVRRVGVHFPDLAGLPEVGRPIYAAAESSAAKHVVIDVPPLGFAWISPADKPQKAAKKEVFLAEGNVVRNEYFEAAINTTTGTLQSIHEYNARGNRLSQQLALRTPSEEGSDGDAAVYSVMAADKVEVTASTTAYGEITSRGRLLDRHGKVVATFVQRYQVWRGSRVLKIEVELEPIAELRSDPWNSYYCLRWAWSDEAAQVVRAVNETRFETEARRFEAPHYIDVADAKTRTTILTGGLPYHRRYEYRLLDTPLIVRGETARKFTVGIGIELAQPLQDALGLLAPVPVAARMSPPPSPATSSWLFHLDAKNVLGLDWAPIERDGRAVGFRVSVLEIADRPGQVAISSFRPVTKARLLGLRGNVLGEAKIDQGRIMLDLAASEWVQVEGEW